MSDSVRPHRWQPTRLPRPWDSPGKNTGVGCHFLLQCMKLKSESEVAQSCPILHDPVDCSLPGSSVHRIFQARVLEWGSIVRSLPICYSKLPFSILMLCWVLSSFSRVQLSVILWTVASQAPLSMGFFRHEYWSGLPLPPPRHLPDSGIKPASPALPGGFLSTVLTGKPDCPLTF